MHSSQSSDALPPPVPTSRLDKLTVVKRQFDLASTLLGLVYTESKELGLYGLLENLAYFNSRFGVMYTVTSDALDGIIKNEKLRANSQAIVVVSQDSITTEIELANNNRQAIENWFHNIGEDSMNDFD